jgi:hypothetical protein
VKGKGLSKLVAHRFRRGSDDTRELAARLAPLEELRESSKASRTNGSQVVAQENGAIVVGVEQSHLATEVIEADEENGAFGLEPVVIVIVGLMLAFIVFIAWQISQMPAQPVTN